MLCLKIAGWVANSVDPDETPHLRCLIWVYTVCSGMSVPILMVNTVNSKTQLWEIRKVNVTGSRLLLRGDFKWSTGYKYIVSNLISQKFSDCVLIGVCVVIRLNVVVSYDNWFWLAVKFGVVFYWKKQQQQQQKKNNNKSYNLIIKIHKNYGPVVKNLMKLWANETFKFLLWNMANILIFFCWKNVSIFCIA